METKISKLPSKMESMRVINYEDTNDDNGNEKNSFLVKYEKQDPIK